MIQIQRSHEGSYIVNAVLFEYRHRLSGWQAFAGYYISYQADLMELAS